MGEGWVKKKERLKINVDHQSFLYLHSQKRENNTEKNQVFYQVNQLCIEKKWGETKMIWGKKV